MGSIIPTLFARPTGDRHSLFALPKQVRAEQETINAKRFNIVKEVLSTEEDYAICLEIMVDGVRITCNIGYMLVAALRISDRGF